MGKKKDAVPPSPTGALTHNPFARLGGALPEVARTQAEADVGAAPSAPRAAEPARHEATAKPQRSSRLVLRRETKHRGGKAVVIVTGFGALAHYDEEATRSLAQQLKQKLGCGGTVERGASGLEIVLQGDHPAKVADFLRGLGFRVDGVTK